MPSSVPTLFRRGDSGTAIVEFRQRLNGLGHLSDDAGGDLFDEGLDLALRHFQQQRGLLVDGIVGPHTVRALDEAHWALGDRLLTYQVSHLLRGDDIAQLQQRLTGMGFDPGRIDVFFGHQTFAALCDFQRNVGLTPDGTCGPATLAALHRLSRSVTGGAPAALREHEALLRQGSTPAGRVIVVDAGHGGPDAGCTSDLLEWSEANIAFDIATRVEGRLTALGATAFLTRPGDLDTALDEQARAEFSNAAGADLVISIHADALTSESARGVATYFFGNTATHSSVGQRLAQLIQDEIVTRTDLPDGRVHGKTWDLLRWTTMPAVRVEIGYLSNPTDAARLSDPGFRDVVAEAIASGVQHLFTPESQG